MKKKLITKILVVALVMGTLSGCGNSSQDSVETIAQTEETAAETTTTEAEDTAKAEEDATAKAEEDAAAKAAEEEAARQEEANASYEAGRACLYGLNGQEIDYEAACNNFENALALDKTEANFYLGLLYDWYSYPEQDYEKAKTYYEAAGDNPYAQLALGFLYYYGQGVEADTAKGEELFEASVAQGCVEGYLGSAESAFDNADYDTAFECYNKVLEGDEETYVAYAMNSIGYMYKNGEGVEQDSVKAVEWYEKAADLGNSSAMFQLGYAYENGEGVEQDSVKAVEWYEKAANLGNDVAMGNLAFAYLYGEGVKQDSAKAVEWLEKSADLGNTISMNNLGYMYENGEGVEQDSAKAQEWYEKAAAAE